MELYITQKVTAGSTPNISDAVSLIESPEQCADSVEKKSSKKRSLSESSDQTDTNDGQNVNFSRFKNTNNVRERSNSVCLSSDNSDSGLPSIDLSLSPAKAVKSSRFKYLSTFSTRQQDLYKSNLPPTVRKLLDKKHNSHVRYRDWVSNHSGSDVENADKSNDEAANKKSDDSLPNMMCNNEISTNKSDDEISKSKSNAEVSKDKSKVTENKSNDKVSNNQSKSKVTETKSNAEVSKNKSKVTDKKSNDKAPNKKSDDEVPKKKQKVSSVNVTPEISVNTNDEYNESTKESLATVTSNNIMTQINNPRTTQTKAPTPINNHNTPSTVEVMVPFTSAVTTTVTPSTTSKRLPCKVLEALFAIPAPPPSSVLLSSMLTSQSSSTVTSANHRILNGDLPVVLSCSTPLPSSCNLSYDQNNGVPFPDISNVVDKDDDSIDLLIKTEQSHDSQIEKNRFEVEQRKGSVSFDSSSLFSVKSVNITSKTCSTPNNVSCCVSDESLAKTRLTSSRFNKSTISPKEANTSNKRTVPVGKETITVDLSTKSNTELLQELLRMNKLDTSPPNERLGDDGFKYNHNSNSLHTTDNDDILACKSTDISSVVSITNVTDADFLNGGLKLPKIDSITDVVEG